MDLDPFFELPALEGYQGLGESNSKTIGAPVFLECALDVLVDNDFLSRFKLL
jgi:hypothetical protein